MALYNEELEIFFMEKLSYKKILEKYSKRKFFYLKQFFKNKKIKSVNPPKEDIYKLLINNTYMRERIIEQLKLFHFKEIVEAFEQLPKKFLYDDLFYWSPKIKHFDKFGLIEKSFPNFNENFIDLYKTNIYNDKIKYKKFENIFSKRISDRNFLIIKQDIKNKILSHCFWCTENCYLYRIHYDKKIYSIGNVIFDNEQFLNYYKFLNTEFLKLKTQVFRNIRKIFPSFQEKLIDEKNELVNDIIVFLCKEYSLIDIEIDGKIYAKIPLFIFEGLLLKNKRYEQYWTELGVNFYDSIIIE